MNKKLSRNIIPITTEDLNDLANLQAKCDALLLRYKDATKKLLTPEQMIAQAQIDTHYKVSMTEVQDEIDTLTDKIKEAVVLHGASIKANFLHGVKFSGKVSWKASGLDGYAIAHPEILAFRKQGDDYCVIKKI